MKRKSEQSNVKDLDPAEEERRNYLKTVGALVAGLAVGGAAAWLAKPPVEVPGATVTAPGVTVTAPGATVTAPGPTVTETVTVAPTPITTFKHGKSLILLMAYTGEYWWYTCVEYFKRAVEADGGWSFEFADCGGSDTMQADQIISYAQTKDVLFVNAVSQEGVNEAVRIAEEEYHCPVIICKDIITGKARFGMKYDDVSAGTLMAKEAVDYLQRAYGTTEGKTVVTLNGDLRQTGWLGRYEGFCWIKENRPEINFVELIGGLTPEGWAEAADAYFATGGADVLLAASDGAYILGALEALGKYGKLYYAGDPKHIFVASIDGKPSTLQWVRRGYMDLVYSQTPDCIYSALWQMARDWVLKDASYQSPPYKLPELQIPFAARQPKGTYWGGENLYTVVDTVPYSKTPIGSTPTPRVTKDNVNVWDLWGNRVTKWLGKEEIQDMTFPAKGTPPEWSDKLIKEYEEWFKKPE